MRRLWLALLLLTLLGFTSGPAATGSTCAIGKGSSCFSDFTTNATDATSVAACSSVRVNFRSNIADSTDNDGTATSYCCPAGVVTATAACGIAIPYRDADGTLQTALTGASGRDNIYDVVCQNLVVVVTTASQTSRVQLDCR